jgi:hypothetical protein
MTKRPDKTRETQGANTETTAMARLLAPLVFPTAAVLVQPGR